MHYRMLVSVPKENAETSAEARSYVSSYLEDNGFCAQGGRFSSSPADWFVIGGRWSGELSRVLLGKKKLAKLEKLFKAEGGDYFTSATVGDKERMEQAKRAFEKFLKAEKLEWPKGVPNTIWRDSYNHDGFDDDAMLLDEKLYDATLKEYEGKRKRRNGFDPKIKYTVENGAHGEYYSDPDTRWHMAWLDTDYRALGRGLIGTSWLVVVDYHS